MYGNQRRTKKSLRLSYNSHPSTDSEPLPDDWYASITENDGLAKSLDDTSIIPQYPDITQPPVTPEVTPDVIPNVVIPQVTPSNFPIISGKSVNTTTEKKEQMSRLNTLILVLVIVGGGYMAMKYMKKNNSRFGMSTTYNIRSAYNMAK
tara:strand:- start:452 stop:898 length:447 start_codon:yes stop_codon:yes gene_type:complete